MSRALAVFTVAYQGIQLRVRLLPTVADVHREYPGGRRRLAGRKVHAYTVTPPCARHSCTVAFGADGCLDELVPHEVTHAVMHRLQVVRAEDDEPLATAVGILTARIHAKLRRVQEGMR